ncbi:MAG TPA: tripartite tricarboxylate transporter substrate binding protein [Burkholderiaceae bacterium]|jgi:tripartite-type tricarboxylate transporter receptor subunit TctC|nr:tripartite tricarboxylate transporter substrate binding protein [Burkholderiaceae bacterium]
MKSHPTTGRPRRLALLSVLVAAALGLPALAGAQAYPSKAIRMIIPAAPGGGTDVMGRTLARVMSEKNGIPVVVENRPGASGSIGVQAVINAPPDGYTILMTLADATTIYPLLKKNPPYRVERDLTPIAQVAFTHVLYAVSATSPYKTVQDLVAASKTSKMAYGSNGFATTAHLWIELFKQKTGADMLHVPYKGAAPALQALIAGEHSMVVASPATLKVQMDAGRVRPIVATSPKRMPGFPDVPTMIESGYPDFVVGAWFGVFAPAKMPAALADKLHDMVLAAMATPEYQKHAESFKFDTPQMPRAEFAKMISADAGVWRSAIEAAKIEPED